MPRLIVLLVGAFCLSCSSQVPVEPAPEKAALGEEVAINGELYRRVVGKATADQANDVIVIAIPVSTSGGTITIANEIQIAGKTYTANCSANDGPSASSDDVGNTMATATSLAAMPPTSEWTFWESRTYQLTPGDVDYFRVRLTQRADLAILSGPSDNSTDPAGTLMTSSGRILDRNDDSSSANDGLHFVLIAIDLSPGTYYVEVKGGTPSAAGPYDLTVATRRPQAGKPVASAAEEIELIRQLEARQ